MSDDSSVEVRSQNFLTSEELAAEEARFAEMEMDRVLFESWLVDLRAWCNRWPKYCEECKGLGGSYDSPPDYDWSDCPHCIEHNRCPRCHGKLRYRKARKSNQIQEGGKCPECGWSYECKDDVAPECPL